ncbi:MAG: hypothetical protein C4326_06905 [Ignavibacteria bacterium]
MPNATPIHIALFSTTPYAFLMQRPQQLAQALVRAGCTVAFVNPVRNPISALVHRLWQSLWHTPEPVGYGAVDVITLDQYQIPIARIPILPYNTTAERIKRSLDVRLDAFFERPGTHVALLETPLWIRSLPFERFDLLCYDCIDEWEIISAGEPEEHKADQRETVGRAGAIFYTAENLRRELEELAPKVPLIKIPNGVDYDWFQSRTAQTNTFRRADPSRLVVGYIGAVYDWIDLGLLINLARLRPSMKFVLVGPLSRTNRKLLAGAPRNLVAVGAVPYSEVPMRVQQFDVCLIPFKNISVAHTTDPIKLYEYFALGKPVVATPMHELKVYEAEGLLKFADTPEAFAQAIEEAAGSDTEVLCEKRRAVARRNSWGDRAARMLQAIREQLE